MITDTLAEQIKVAYAEQVAATGVAPLAAVADKVGLSKSSIYRVFAGGVHEITEALAMDLARDLCGAIVAAHSPWDIYDGWITANPRLFACVAAHPPALGLVHDVLGLHLRAAA